MTSQEHVGRDTGRGMPRAFVRTYNQGQELVSVVHMAGAEDAQHVGVRFCLSISPLQRGLCVFEKTCTVVATAKNY